MSVYMCTLCLSEGLGMSYSCVCVCVFVDVQKTRVKEKFEGSPLHLFSASLWWDHIIHRGLSGNFISL